MTDTTATSAAPRTRFRILRFMWRHKKLSAALLVGVAGADVAYGPRVVNHFAGAPPAIKQRLACVEEICNRTTLDTKNAFALWLASKNARKATVPSYLNLRYAVGAVGIESEGGSFLKRKGSRYSGAMQFSRTDTKTHFFTILPALIETLKHITATNPDAIPALKGKKIDRATLLTPAIFNDTTVQVIAGMELALHASARLEEMNSFKSFSEFEKHAGIYLYHNLPRMSRVVIRNFSCERPVIALSPDDKDNFRANSGIYSRDGVEIPARVLYRVMSIKHPFVVQAGLVLNDKDLSTTAAPRAPSFYGDYGIFSHVIIRTLRNGNACTKG